MACPQPTHSLSANISNRKTGSKPAGLPKLLPALALAGATLGLATSPVQALTTFAGTYAPANWTQSIGGDGSIDPSGAPASITLVSANNATDTDILNFTDFTISAPSSGTVNFNWNYTSLDTFGPSFDPFGYLLNGVFTQLTNDSGAAAQSGSASFSLLTGDVFGFRQTTVDSLLGSASTTISNFNAPVVPGPLPLLGAGAALGWSRRLRYRLRAGLPASPQA